MKLELPLGEIRGVAVCIYPVKPDSCPTCGGSLEDCDAEVGVSINVGAWKCKTGHRVHAFLES